MNRREFGKLTGGAAAATATLRGRAQNDADEWKAGKDSPIHDSDRLVPFSGQVVTLENEYVRLELDAVSGALLGLLSKKTGWQAQRSATLGSSFRIFAPTSERSFNPVLGSRNRVRSIKKSADGQSVQIVWADLVSEFSCILNVTLSASIVLNHNMVTFNMHVKNESPLQVSSVEWPIIGALSCPPDARRLQNLGFTLGGYTKTTSIYPHFPLELNGCGVSFPMQASEGRYNLLIGKQEGLYIGSHDATGEEVTRYTLELKPGWLNSMSKEVPDAESVTAHPIRITHSVVRFPFIEPGEQRELATIVIAPYVGTWHAGADVYRSWFKTWYKRPISPDWFAQPHTWQQIQINSSEDDLRTSYKDLPRRALQAANAGVTALQVTGWNHLGQDRNNPSHDTDPRLGSHEDFKDAIARIEKMGVHVILFNKFTWGETSTEWYKRELYRYMALDPNGVPYYHHGFKYQTPIQLADINTRRFSVACQNSGAWQKICMSEFEKSINLGASGILYDEVMHHGGASYCFAPDHGHRYGASLFAGDLTLGRMFRERIRETKGEKNFLMAGEGLSDIDSQLYALSYIRINDDHVPVSRYNDPFAPIMIAITGFDDREMINAALRYRYIMSYEPFIFKGNMEDFPLTVKYGQLAETFRKSYRRFLWDGEFLDNQGAKITSNGKPYDHFAVFRAPDATRGAVIVNQGLSQIAVSCQFDGGASRELSAASPEQAVSRRISGIVEVPGRSILLVMES